MRQTPNCSAFKTEHDARTCTSPSMTAEFLAVQALSPNSFRSCALINSRSSRSTSPPCPGRLHTLMMAALSVLISSLCSKR